MTTSTFEVGDLFSVLGAHGIERQVQRIAGVGRVSVNPVSGSTTVLYDPEKTNLGEIRAAIKECGFHCAGEALPKHVCQDHRMPDRSHQTSPVSKINPAPSHEHAGHDGTDAGKKLAVARPNHNANAHGSEMSDAMAHEMGHGAGQDMQGSLGIPKDSVIEYEQALKADGFVIVAHGPVEELARAKTILETMKPISLDLHRDVKDLPALPADHVHAAA